MASDLSGDMNASVPGHDVRFIEQASGYAYACSCGLGPVGTYRHRVSRDKAARQHLAAVSAMPDPTNAYVPTGADLIAAERQRQINVEGYTPEHDAEHGGASHVLYSDLLGAAVCYAIRAHLGRGEFNQAPPTRYWPSGWEWKPEDPLRNLVKAGALIAAEIDRVQALNAPSTSDAGPE